MIRLTSHCMAFVVFLSLLPASMAAPVANDLKPSQQHITSWIRQLGSPEYQEREEAMSRLRRLGGQILTPLVKALTDPDQEIARRALTLVKDTVSVEMKRGSRSGYQTLASIAQLKDKSLSQWALSRLGQDADKEIKPARDVLQQLINGKDKKLAAKAQQLLRPPLTVLQERMLEIRNALTAAARAGQRDEMQKLMEDYRKIRTEIRERQLQDRRGQIRRINPR